jgi:hypothetical protein
MPVIEPASSRFHPRNASEWPELSSAFHICTKSPGRERAPEHLERHADAVIAVAALRDHVVEVGWRRECVDGLRRCATAYGQRRRCDCDAHDSRA